MADTDDVLSTEIHPAGYAVLTLNRPQAMNALNKALMRALADAIDDLGTNPAVRSLPGGLPEVRPVPNLPPRDGSCRRVARRDEVVLVIPTLHTSSAAGPDRDTTARRRRSTP